MPTFADLRQQVCEANHDLHRHGLVHAHSGNASGIDREAGVVLIKPSGVDIQTLRPEALVATALDGRRLAAREVPDGIASPLRPSVDLRHHLELYAADPSLGGIVHTHSIHATAWALVERPIPCAMTSMADEFGGDIPCAPYVDNADDHIARAIMAHRTRAPAILLGRHGVFAFDRTPALALKAALLTEVAAHTVMLAMGLGTPARFSDAEIEKWWQRYHAGYGQQPPA
ncbi:MAG: class II aldolase/adducin family protein [Gemmatimonadetes bacterium]|nr:class II aldolase/adducin family protein [Gemmatimonadota bacterium]